MQRRSEHYANRKGTPSQRDRRGKPSSGKYLCTPSKKKQSPVSLHPSWHTHTQQNGQCQRAEIRHESWNPIRHLLLAPIGSSAVACDLLCRGLRGLPLSRYVRPQKKTLHYHLAGIAVLRTRHWETHPTTRPRCIDLAIPLRHTQIRDATWCILRRKLEVSGKTAKIRQSPTPR